MNAITNVLNPRQQFYQSIFNTASGRVINLDNPTREMINIEDIANSLSKKCLFGGHTSHFYSFAQHSVLVAKMIESSQPTKKGRHLLEALLHNASKAYLGDFIKPVEKTLHPVFKRIRHAIAAKFGLNQSARTQALINKYESKAMELERIAFQEGNTEPLIAEFKKYGLYLGGASNWSVLDAKLLFLKTFKEMGVGVD
ncbi:hypothetical protein [Parasediminibacterium sp. JCM 36343]|uniref:hypothetical protein n=1 Tax=Parasediminibacterium sp. JCM 36343 TaxID=3374279 RepID=UPI00397D1638